MARELRVAVVQPPLVLGADYIDYPWFANLGAVHTAGVVRAAGFPVRLLDAFSTYGANLYPYEEETRFWGVPVPRLLAPLEDEPADVVVLHHPPFLYLDGANPHFASLVAAVRERLPEARVVLDDGYLGAMHYVDHDRADVLRRYPGLDYACQYESDETLPALLRAIAAGAAPPCDAPASARVLRQTGEPPLDTLPLPAWDLVSAPDYAAFLKGVFDRSRRVNPFRVAPDTRPLVTSRGCTYRCIFCSSNPWAGPGKPHRFRSLGLSLLGALLRLLRETQDAWHLNVLDQAANLNPAFGDVLALFEEQGFVYDFPNGLRADYLTDEHLQRMRGRIGTLSVSAESGSQHVVDRIVRKRLPLGEVERVAKTARRLGIPLVIHYMVGLPGETRREILQTFWFALRLFETTGAEPLVSFATPMVGTELWRIVHEQGLDDGATATPQHEQVQHRAVAATAAAGRERVGAEELTGALKAFRRRVRSAATRKVVVNLTYRCNNHCRFCAVGNPEGTVGDALAALPAQAGAPSVGFRETPREDAAEGELIRVLDAYYEQGVRLVDFDGGEPLLHPRHVQVIRHARRRGYERVTLTTNGRVLSYEATTCELLACGLHALLVSLHGATAATHEALTRTPGSFPQTLEGLRTVQRLRQPGFDLGVNTTVTALNLGELDALAALLTELGVDVWNLQLVTPYGRATADLVPGAGELRAALAGVLERWSARLRMQVVNAPPCLLPGWEDRVIGDVAKAERDMVFVTKEQVNLANYLALRRLYTERCADCLYRPACAGEYRFA